ncbi:MAG: coproporphyrinogen dehydrogenase, partial [Gammaproteobacteria bacterium]|nr:coproporphyrinogen dehydrogenase [Gammaproteobacteria bacterium]
LAQIGFSRFSIGVQDFSPEVQEVINRQQSKQATLDSIAEAMSVGKSVNVDLITGLPLQTPESFAETLNQVIDTGVTRIAAYNFAYIPERIKSQKLIDKKLLPPAQVRFEIVRNTRQILTAAGYQHIGMDHYALPHDSLAMAHGMGTLQRNFQGYTTHRDTDLIGVGVSAISKFETAFAQNSSKLSVYNEMIDDKRLPIAKGLSLNDDDRLRAVLIQQIMCQNSVDLETTIGRHIETSSRQTMREYFKRELRGLESLANDQLVVFTEQGFDITGRGRYFMRQIACVFDRYLNGEPDSGGNIVQFSRSI